MRGDWVNLQLSAWFLSAVQLIDAYQYGISRYGSAGMIYTHPEKCQYAARQIFLIGTVRYAEGLWHMRRHGPDIAHCTDSEDFPAAKYVTSYCPYLLALEHATIPAVKTVTTPDVVWESLPNRYSAL